MLCDGRSAAVRAPLRRPPSSAASSRCPAAGRHLELAATLFEPGAAAAGEAPAGRDRRRHGGEARLLRTVCHLSGRAGPSRPHLRLSRHRRLAPRLAGRLQGAHARLVHPRRAGRARLGAPHLSRSAPSTGSATAWAASPPGSPTTTTWSPASSTSPRSAATGAAWPRPSNSACACSWAPSAPPVVWAKGYFPGELMGGEDMPGPAFLEWMGWCMKPEFLFDDETLPERRNFARLPRSRPLRADRRRPLGHACRRRPHGRALHGQHRPLDLAGDARRSRRAARSATSASSARTCATRCGRPRRSGC